MQIHLHLKLIGWYNRGFTKSAGFPMLRRYTDFYDNKLIDERKAYFYKVILSTVQDILFLTLSFNTCMRYLLRFFYGTSKNFYFSKALL